MAIKIQDSMQRQIIQTKDGSKTLYIPELDENYHSSNGAIQESMHVFINSGLKTISDKSINIFEMGFGTGLNCMLTLLQSKGLKIKYTCIEKYPLGIETLNGLNYIEQLKLSHTESLLFNRMHSSEWNKEIVLNNAFLLEKHQSDLLNFEHKTNYHLVYFDAFAPEVQPKLWEPEIFEKLYKAMKPGGILTTYCAKGVVRRRMEACGFKMERLPGPPGKREILRATR